MYNKLNCKLYCNKSLFPHFHPSPQHTSGYRTTTIHTHTSTYSLRPNDLDDHPVNHPTNSIQTRPHYPHQQIEKSRKLAKENGVRTIWRKFFIIHIVFGSIFSQRLTVISDIFDGAADGLILSLIPSPSRLHGKLILIEHFPFISFN